jgi:hypothetical protein
MLFYLLSWRLVVEAGDMVAVLQGDQGRLQGPQ